jgi:crotonobetainyl-CoA:carnitine CoA-transferase CaiB-like acyl-CoA transferase
MSSPPACPRPLDGVRVLAAEQMQALPYATMVLARLGADVVKVEPPGGESGRQSQPAVLDGTARPMGATFLRNNLGKRSVAIDLRTEAGRDLFLRLAPRFEVVAENYRSGAMARLGLGYGEVRAVHPSVIYVSVSGFGQDEHSPYAGWPAYASIVEAMSGIYDYTRRPDEPPRANPVGALGDISSALFTTVGIMAALRHRDRTGQGQHVDVAMLDSTVAMTDHPEWLDDGRLATRAGWGEHLEGVIRPGVETWAASRTKVEAARGLMAEGVAAGPCATSRDVLDDAHLRARDMLLEVPRTDGGRPVIVPGNPIKLSAVAGPDDQRLPCAGQDTDAVLSGELGLGDDELDRLAGAGVIGR